MLHPGYLVLVESKVLGPKMSVVSVKEFSIPA